MTSFECIKHHAKVIEAQREWAIQELAAYKGIENIIYFNQVTVCPLCQKQLLFNAELKIEHDEKEMPF